MKSIQAALSLKYLVGILTAFLLVLGGWVIFTDGQPVEVQTTIDHKDEEPLPEDQIRPSTSGLPKGDVSGQSLDTTQTSVRHRGVLAVEEYTCTTEKSPYPHVCFRLVDTQTEEVQIAQLTDLARKQGVLAGERSELYGYLYETNDANTVYFMTGIPDTDGCCGLVEFHKQEKTFRKRDDLYVGIVASELSKSKRYIGTASDDLKVFKLADLELGKVIYEDSIKTGALGSTACTMFGIGNDIMFSEDETVVTYGIYSEQKAPDDDCKFQLIETRKYKIQ